MEYNNQFAKLENTQSELLDQILGYTKITYTKTDKKHHGLPAVEVTLDGNKHDFEFLEFVYPYKQISCDDKFVVIEHKDEELGDIKLVLNFENSNTYWLSPEILPNSREYLVRVSN